MKHPRLYVPLDLAVGAELSLPEAAANHLRVLRVPVGNPVTLFNGRGGEFAGVVSVQEKRHVCVRIAEHSDREAESPLGLTLIQGISKGDRMDFTIQKAVELGVQGIVPVFTGRSVVRLEGDRLARREEHWRGIVVSACEQCGRNRVPELAPARDLSEILREMTSGLRLVLDPGAGATLKDLRLESQVSLLIGPEGGLTEAEVEQARRQGFTGVRLGPRVLRTETAGIAALAALQALAGDLG